MVQPMARWMSLFAACLPLACSAAGPARHAPTSAPADTARELRVLPTPALELPQPSRHISPNGSQALSQLTADALEGTYREPVVLPEETRAVVLLYHAFDKGPQPLSLSSRRFAAQLDWLRENHVEIVPLSHLVEYLRGERRLPRRVAVITLDDGMLSVYAKAWPVMRERQVPFTLGIPSGLVGAKRGRIMSWAAVREMVSSGLCEIASHGHHHRRLVGLSGKQARRELMHSREVIEQRTGTRPSAYFYPLGALDDKAAQRVEKAGYAAAFTASGAPISLGSSSHLKVPRTTIFHDDGVGRFGWFFGEQYLGRLPIFAAAPLPESARATRQPRVALLGDAWGWMPSR